MKTAAILTVKDAGRMTKSGRRRIAKWLRQQADDLVILGQRYGKTLRARYWYEDSV